MGILNDIEQNQKKGNTSKIVFGLIVISILGYFIYPYIFSTQIETIEKEIKEFSVKTGNLKTSIEGDGKVLYKEDFNLNFPISGTVNEILKNEGDIVEVGDIIAKLDTTYLEINVDKAEIALKKSYSDLESRKNRTTDSEVKLGEEQLGSTQANYENIKLAGEVDISNTKIAMETSKLNLDSAESDLKTAKANLNLTQKQEEEKYNNKLEDGISEIGSIISYMDQYLLDIDELLGITDENKYKNDNFENYLGAKDTSVKSLAENTFRDANKTYLAFASEWKNYRSGEEDITKVLGYLDKAELSSKLVNKTLNYTLDTIKNSVNSTSFTETQVSSYINSFENSVTNMKKEIHDLIDVKQAIEEQSTTVETKIATENNIISSLTSKLELAKKQLEQATLNYSNAQKKAENNLILAEKQISISEASLGTKTEAVSYSDLAPYYNNIENSKKILEEAKIKLEDAVLRSPINGKIVSIEGNIGSFVGGDKEASFVTITNNNKFYIESFVEELDITRVKEGGDVYLTFDALDGVSLSGKAYFISDKSTTDNNGIVTYKVEIAFDPKNSGVREGMTTYVEYITNEVKNVKIIPVEAVKPVSGKPLVMLQNGSWIDVLTGFTDGKMVEIITGLEKGDIVKY